LRTSSSRELNFEEVKVRYGKKYYGVDEFSRQTTEDDHWRDRVDLRGISILQKELYDSVVKNVDFSYAALDGCEFVNVVFNNCKFDRTSLIDVRLIGCHFQDTCEFVANDFSRALIDSTFDCDIVSPKITYPRLWWLFRVRHTNQSRYLRFTKIINETFSTKCDDEKIKRFVNK
jgi:hypothetical protein